jgi:tetratricopeptide (TPR) repeat protein
MTLIDWFRTRIKRRTATRKGRQYWREGKYELSVQCYEEALLLDVATKGPQHAHVAQDYDNIGVAYRGMGQYDRAIEYYEKAVAILEEITPEHILLPSPYNHIGIAYRYKNDYDRAVEYHEKALRIQKRWGGPLAGPATRTTETLLEAARAKQRCKN